MTIPIHTKIIVCDVIKEEIQSLLPPEITIEVFDSDLHLVPKKLNIALQEAIDTVNEGIKIIVLGYGLCSLSIVGLKANGCTLVIPRVHDCIALFLGSADSYKQQTSKEPGTFYLTKGWIEAGITPFEDYEQLVSKYGQERADYLMKLMFKDYTRLAFIEGEESDTNNYCDFTRRTAKKFSLRYENISGSNRLFKKMLFGPWDDDFVVVQPGQTVTYMDFMTE